MFKINQLVKFIKDDHYIKGTIARIQSFDFFTAKIVVMILDKNFKSLCFNQRVSIKNLVLLSNNVQLLYGDCNDRV